MAMNNKAQMPMPGRDASSPWPWSKARRRACAPANRQKMIQPFARSRAIPMSGRSGQPRLLDALVADALGNQEGQFQRLAGIQPGIAGGLVAVLQVDFLQTLRAAQALGDVLAGHLEMHAAGMRPLGAMDGEEAAH